MAISKTPIMLSHLFYCQSIYLNRSQNGVTSSKELLSSNQKVPIQLWAWHLHCLLTPFVRPTWQATSTLAANQFVSQNPATFFLADSCQNPLGHAFHQTSSLGHALIKGLPRMLRRRWWPLLEFSEHLRQCPWRNVNILLRERCNIDHLSFLICTGPQWMVLQ